MDTDQVKHVSVSVADVHCVRPRSSKQQLTKEGAESDGKKQTCGWRQGKSGPEHGPFRRPSQEKRWRSGLARSPATLRV